LPLELRLAKKEIIFMSAILLILYVVLIIASYKGAIFALKKAKLL
jgi:hypothetical protein